MHGFSRPQQTNYHQKNNSARIALRTIPVKFSFGGREILANCILDDGSTCSFINSDMVEILGLPRENQHSMAVGVLNGSSERFFSSNVAFSIASMDGKNKFSINAMTINRVTGTLEPVNWKEQALQFKHLRKIPFWKPNRGKISVLLGMDHVHLHRALQEVYGGYKDPVARLTPLGWTCTGRTSYRDQSGSCSRFASTFFQHNKGGIQQIEKYIKLFWEIEEAPTFDKNMSLNNRDVYDSMTRGLKHIQGGRYEVPIPWKRKMGDLPENYPMAHQRLRNTGQKLEKNGDLKEIQQMKGYPKLSWEAEVVGVDDVTGVEEEVSGADKVDELAGVGDVAGVNEVAKRCSPSGQIRRYDRNRRCNRRGLCRRTRQCNRSIGDSRGILDSRDSRGGPSCQSSRSRECGVKVGCLDCSPVAYHAGIRRNVRMTLRTVPLRLSLGGRGFYVGDGVSEVAKAGVVAVVAGLEVNEGVGVSRVAGAGEADGVSKVVVGHSGLKLTLLF